MGTTVRGDRGRSASMSEHFLSTRQKALIIQTRHNVTPRGLIGTTVSCVPLQLSTANRLTYLRMGVIVVA